MQPTEDILRLFVIFSIIIILVASVFLFLFYQFTRTKNQILREKLQEKLETEVLINRAELLALRSQMNPHFVFNALNTVQYFIQQNDLEQSEEFLAKFSHLVRNFFNYSREKDIALQEELEFIKLYLKIEKLRFEDKLNYNIEVDEDIDEETTRIPSMILQPIIENAINHGIFHKKGEGIIEINFKKLPNAFRVTIQDNGIGIRKSKQLYKKNQHPSQSHSTHILDERLKLLRDSKQWDVDYSIEDLSDKNPEQSGTCVTLIIHPL